MSEIDILKLILNGFELAACIVSFFYWKKLKNTYWKWFPFYLLFIILVEFTGKYLTHENNFEVKENMYNYISIPAEILFYLFIFSNEFKRTKVFWLPISCSVVYVACLLVEALYLTNKYDWFLSFSYTIGVIFLVLNILVFLFKLVTSNEVINFRSNLGFWVCLGLLLFYLGSLPFQGIMTYLYKEQKKAFMNYVYLFYVFDCLMYLSFIIGFICGKVKYRDS